MDKLLRNLLIGLAILILLVPLGLLAVGTAFGEWGIEELEEEVGFIPTGLESLASTWTAPIPDYALEALGEELLGISVGYWLSAIIGVIVCGVLLWLLGKALVRGSSKNSGL